MKKYTLFIDESGSLDLNNKNSKYYALSGCAMPDYHRQELGILADQIKFKYWSRTDVVFHSRAISRNEGDFSIFKKDNSRKEEFINDLIKFLEQSNVIVLPILVDKEASLRSGWNNIKVVKETAKYMMQNFINLLLTKKGVSGQVIIESATAEKDSQYLEMFGYFLSPACKELSVDYKVMQKTLTSISFVTKHNHDIEEQIADLFAYAITSRYLKENKIEEYEKDSYESRIIRVLEAKLFRIPSKASEEKMDYFNKIESFKVIPEAKVVN